MDDPFLDWINRVAPLALALAAVICMMAALAGCGDLHLHYHAAAAPQAVLELPDPAARDAVAPGEEAGDDGPDFILELPK